MGAGSGEALRALGVDLPNAIHWDSTPITDGRLALPIALGCTAGGVVLLSAVLHLARAVANLHGKLAKHLLVAG